MDQKVSTRKHFLDILQETIRQEQEKGNAINKVSFQIEFFCGLDDNIKTISYSGNEYSHLS